MKLKLLKTALTAATFAVLCGAQAVSAQDETQNVFAAPYEVIPDHPNCSGPGKIAFKTEFQAKDIKFEVGLNERARSIYFGAGGVVERNPDNRVCSVKTRRGAETITTRVQCPDLVSKPSKVSDLAAELSNTINSANLSGRLSGCLSLAGFELLDNEWSFDIELVDGTSRTLAATSAADVFSADFAHPTGRGYYSLDRPQIRVQLSCQPIELETGQDLIKGVSLTAIFNIYEHDAATCGRGDFDCFSREERRGSWPPRQRENKSCHD